MVLLGLMITLIAILNIKLNYRPETTIIEGDSSQIEVVRELRGIKSALERNADVEMQNVYPEGYVFTNALYALAWSSVIHPEANQELFDEGHTAIKEAWKRIDSETGRSTFNESLLPPYGSFYSGWSSYVLGSKLRLESPDRRDDLEIYQFKQQCDQIASAVREHVYPASYDGGTWPADVTICVATLSMHDDLFEPRYKEIIEHWLSEVRVRLDSAGMIPHAIDPAESAYQGARGSSMALTLIFLRDIDLPFAKSQFSLFKKNFVDTKFDLTGIREYPKGRPGSGDIDSGPVILGFGGAATIVGMRTLSAFGEDDLCLRIRNVVESLAFPIQSDGEKKYLFGALPIADAFIAWSHSGMRPSGDQVSFIQFRVYSFLIFIALSTGFWMLIPASYPRSRPAKSSDRN